MVEQNPALDAIFHALADPTRRAMVQSLLGGECNIGELGAPFAMSFAAASKHVKVLEGAGLVRREVCGRSHVCRLEPEALASAERWISTRRAAWNRRFDRLGAFLDATKEDGT
ncbi:MAG: ArsR/SmtB family transcription factor [Rhodospirillaceae bacterium]